MEYGTIDFVSKKPNLRIGEINHKLGNLIDRVKPTVLLTHLLDLRWTMKKDLVKIQEIKTLLRLLCMEKNVMYTEFRTYGYEYKIFDQKKPSPKRKLDLLHEYKMCKDVTNVHIANCVFLGENVAHHNLQIGSE